MRSAENHAFLGLVLLLLGWMTSPAADTNLASAPVSVDLASPALMTGTFYEIGSNHKKVLYKFRRAAVRAGEAVQVEQLFSLPDGSPACRETIRYRNNRLVSYNMEDLRAEVRGSIVIEAEPKKKEKIFLEEIQGRNPGAKILKGVENLPPNTLIGDTIYPFILTHWGDLMRGGAVKFHFISLDPPTTFAFKVVRESDGVWKNQPVARIKMEPANVLIAHLVHPIIFNVEKAEPHRLFSYTGRTTPRDKTGGTWKIVEAEAVFDWP
jgi:hypothetical protein